MGKQNQYIFEMNSAALWSNTKIFQQGCHFLVKLVHKFIGRNHENPFFLSTGCPYYYFRPPWAYAYAGNREIPIADFPI